MLITVCQSTLNHKKFLKFSYKGILFKFTSFPNGLSSCLWKFTKLLKPVLATLQVNGHIIIVYIGDLLLIGHSYDSWYEKCISTIIDTLTSLHKLGFVIHPLKSLFVPVQKISFLGFLINSHTMTICLTDEKKAKLVSLINNILASDTIRIQSVAQVIGHMVSSFPAIEYGPLYYRKLDKDKSNALAIHKGNFEAPMPISSEAKVEWNWWLTNIPTSFQNIRPAPITFYLDYEYCWPTAPMRFFLSLVHMAEQRKYCSDGRHLIPNHPALTMKMKVWKSILHTLSRP